MEVEDNMSKIISQNLEEAIETIIDNHEALKSNPYVVTVDSIVKDIMKLSEIKEITEHVAKEIEHYNDISTDSNLDMDEFYNTHDLSLLANRRTWTKELKLLREHLLSKNNDLFLLSYKTHFSLINNPETVNEGILNIIRTLKIYFLNMSKQFNTIGMRINLNLNTQKNLLKIVNMLLKSLDKLHKNHKQQNVEPTIIQLMELIALPTLSKKIHFLNFAAIIDPEAIWFKRLSSFSFYRNIIIGYLKDNPALMEYFITEIIWQMYNENEIYSQHIVINQKSEIHSSVNKTATFYSFLHIVGQMLRFSYENMFISNLKLCGEPVTVCSFIKYLIDAANNFSNSRSQNGKYKVIISVLKQVIVENTYVLNDPEVVKKFLSPLKINDNSKIVITAGKKYIYIFEICATIIQMENGFITIYGFKQTDGRILNRKKSSSSFKSSNSNLCTEKIIKQYLNNNKEGSIADTLVNFTTFIIKYFMNKKKYNVPFVYIVLNHCIDVLTCDYHVLYWYKIEKLIMCLRELFNKLTHSTPAQSPNDKKCYISNLQTLRKALYVLSGNSQTIFILSEDKHFFNSFAFSYLSMNENFWEDDYFSTFFINLCTHANEVVLAKKDKIIEPVFNNIWTLLEDEIILLSGSDRLLNDNICKFMKIIITLAMDLNCSQVMFKELRGNKSMPDPNKYPTEIDDLITYSLHISGPENTINYIVLEHNFKLKEKLIERRNECLVEDAKEATIIIDECSVLRQEIIDHIKHIGFPNFVNDSAKMANSLIAKKQFNQLQRVLKDTKHSLHDNSWLVQIRRAHKVCLDDIIKEYIIYEVISYVKILHQSTKNKFMWPVPELNLKELQPEELIGVSIIIKFGLENKILSASLQNEVLLVTLLKQVHYFTRTNKNDFIGFDWFTGIIFLICGGNIDKCKSSLIIISELPIGPYIWPALRKHEPKQFWKTFESNILILIHELELDNLFKMSQISVIGLLQYLLNYCFLNILDWNEICHFLLLVFTSPVEYLAYYIIVMIQYVQDDLVNLCVTNNDVNLFKKILEFKGFRLKEALPVIENLAKQYKYLFSDRK